MEDNSIYITINHLDDFECTTFLRPGDKLILKKDRDNIYDDEAILVYKENKTKVGYVANSVHSVARGTFSAGRAYDWIKDDTKCVVRFVIGENGTAIVEVSIRRAIEK